MEGIKSSSTTRHTVSDDIITSLKTENDNLRRQYDQLAREMNKIKSHIATQQSSSINQSLIGSDDALADKLPAYIENELYKVPKLYTENPWSLIKFLDKLFNLNEMNSVFFKQIFRRIATYQQNSILHRLASEQDLNFKKVADELMEELTTPQTKLNLVQEKILRSQNYLENFRTYVDDVIKFNRILSQYSEQDVVKSILQGTNSNTRAKFHFSTRPKNFAELRILVAEVEKLELNENLHKSKTQSRKQFMPPSGPSQTQVEHVEDGRKIRPNHRPYQPNFSAPRFDKTKSVTEQKQQKGATSGDRTHESSRNQNQRFSKPKPVSFREKNPNFNKPFQQGYFHHMLQYPYPYMTYPWAGQIQPPPTMGKFGHVHNALMPGASKDRSPDRISLPRSTSTASEPDIPRRENSKKMGAIPKKRNNSKN
ncbi:unnamed protein product, partial [Nesidiocoris tenuis]